MSSAPLSPFVIVNLKRAVDDFQRHQKLAGEMDFFSNEIIHSVVNCLDDKALAKQELETFVSEVEFCERMYNNGELLPNSHAAAVLALGLTVLEEITALNLYDEDGRLHYEYVDPDIHGFSDLVLSRIDD